MATDIQFSDITNATTLTDGTGYFDKLMKTINLYIEDQYKKGRLKGPDYATVYLGSMQMALQTAEQFAMNKKLQEKQIDIAYIEKVLKDKEAVKAGLDKLNKTVSDLPEDVYTPKYETI